VIGYGGIRARYLITGDRPNISSFTIEDERNGTQLVDLNELNFMVAFTVEAIRHGGHNVAAIDPNYVEWTATFYEQ